MTEKIQIRDNIANSLVQKMVGELAVNNIALQADIDVLKIMIQERDDKIVELALEISELKEKYNAKMETERKPNPVEESTKPNVPKTK